MAAHYLHADIEIQAPAERVWTVLTDFATYPQWNPFIKSVVGSPQKGERLQIVIQPSGGKALRFSPIVLTADTGRELRWLGRLMLPGIFDGEHWFVIEPLTGDRVRFTQRERFTGLLVRPLRTSLDRDTQRGFEEMNLALKTRAEA